MNFYEVKIGTMTRAGNLNVLHSFVCRSENNEYKVENHYRIKYSGFDVRLSPVDVIEEVSTNNPESVSESPQIKELENEIRELKKNKNTRFSIEYGSSKFSPKTKELYEDMLEKRSEYRRSVGILNKSIKEELLKAYSPFAESISMDQEVDGRDVKFKGIIYLHNSLF